MTADDLTRAVVERAAEKARDDRGHRRLWIAAVAVILGVLVLAATYLLDRSALQGDVTSLTRNVDTLRSQADASNAAARALAEQVQRLGQQPVVSVPQLPPPPRPTAARGITGTTITSSGHLLIAYTDGTTEDKGAVVRTGPAGADGVGIVGTSIADGVLVLRYSDGRTEALGKVVGATGDTGPAGRSVTSVEASAGRLLVKFSDGTTQDAGALPAGRDGRGVTRAVVVACRWQVTYTDGATEDAGNACTTRTVAAPPPTTTTTPGLLRRTTGR